VQPLVSTACRPFVVGGSGKPIRYQVAVAVDVRTRAHWTGGHLMEPYEQKTQQSPGLGFSRTPQFPHS
jgi:hypothetical protein